MNFLEYRDIYKENQEVWICDFRYNNIDEKAIRHIRPQKVVALGNDKLPSNKTVYHSEFHFRPIGKKGEPLKQVIAPFDNTAWGKSVNIFFEEEECKNFYISQCQDIIEECEKQKISRIKAYNNLIDEVNREIEKLEGKNE